MNSFFFKNLISSTSNNQNQDEEQSDFERLIELCNSYGLNQQETKQLISEFKKGSYKSATSSLNQSMVSDQHDISISENGDQTQRNYQYSKDCSLEPSRTFQQQKHSNLYEQEPNLHQSQSSNRYYGYQNENQMEEKHQDSYNEMTFNEQNSMMLNSHRYQDGQGHFNADSRHSTLKQEMIHQQRVHQRPLEKNFVEQKPLERNNSRKETLLQKRPSNQLTYQNSTQINNSEPVRNFKESISTKTLSQQHEKGSQQTSKYSQNSIQSHDIENQPVNGLNPEYVKALIRNFEILQGQNQSLKEENSNLTEKITSLSKEFEMTKRENDKMRNQLEEIKNQQKFSSNQTAKFEAHYEAEKQKNQMLLSMKENDSEVIKGLKDSLMQLTELIKEKDTQNCELQQRLFGLYDKLQGQQSSSSKYLAGSQINGSEFEQTGGSSETYFGKSFSKKSLVSSQSEKSFKPDRQEEVRERNSNYGRKDLSEMSGSSMNVQQNGRGSGQEGKQLVREPSASRLSTGSNIPQGYSKQTGYSMPPQVSQMKDPIRESKQNVFSPLQVEPAIKRNNNPSGQNSIKTHQENKKRPSSRVDIKKYKGMIEELRNSYSNVENSNQMMR